MRFAGIALVATAAYASSLYSPSVTVNEQCYHYGDTIKVFFHNTNSYVTDWVGIYDITADTNALGEPLLWLYGCGSQSVCYSLDSGHLMFGSGGPTETGEIAFPLPAGHYIAVLVRQDSKPYHTLAVSEVFTVKAPGDSCTAPPPTPKPTPQPTPRPPTPSPVPYKTIVDVLEHDGNFNTLLFFLRATGLDYELKGNSKYTIFAPNDAAFARLGDAVLASLSLNPERLYNILVYHLVAGQILSGDLQSGDLTTINGNPISVQVSHEGILSISVNDVRVLRLDITASNGVIHELRQVLFPPEPFVSPDKACYDKGESIFISFVDGTGAEYDWVGIYDGDANNHYLLEPLLWLYTCGTQHICEARVNEGVLRFGPGMPDESNLKAFPLSVGHYKAVLTSDGHSPYTPDAVSFTFEIKHQCATPSPTAFPTRSPISNPTAHPTPFPTKYPTSVPTKYPTSHPTRHPTPRPTPRRYPYPTGGGKGKGGMMGRY